MKKIIITLFITILSSNVMADVKIGPVVGIFHGLGVELRVGSNIGFEAVTAYKPHLIIKKNYWRSDSYEYDYLGTYEVGGHFYYTSPRRTSKFSPGFILGLKKNNIKGLGIAGGFKGIVDLLNMDLDIDAGIIYYPDGRINVMDEKGYYDVNDFGTTLELGVGVGFMF